MRVCVEKKKQRVHKTRLKHMRYKRASAVVRLDNAPRGTIGGGTRGRRDSGTGDATGAPPPAWRHAVSPPQTRYSPVTQRSCRPKRCDSYPSSFPTVIAVICRVLLTTVGVLSLFSSVFRARRFHAKTFSVKHVTRFICEHRGSRRRHIFVVGAGGGGKFLLETAGKR